MALDATTLANLIKSKVEEKTSALDPETDADQYGDALLEGIAEAVVEHIQAEAELKDAETSGGEAVTGGVE
jgi:non-homologous end joining protein Ku